MNPARARENLGVPTYSVRAELRRLIEEALRCLEDTDLHGASAALQNVIAEAASLGDADGLPRYVGADDGPAQGGHEARKESEGWG